MEHRRSPLPIFAAFDLEFDRPLPPSWGSEKTTIERRQNEQQVNIIAASVVEFNSFAPRTRTFRSLAPLPMSTSKIMSFAHHLLSLHEQGYAIVSWGGTASDFRMLCGKLEAYPELVRDLKRLCMSHVDIPIAILAQHGMMVGLESVAKACFRDKRDGKEESSKDLAEIWKQGGRQSLKVLRHVEEDALLTGRVFGFVMSTPRIRFDGSSFAPPVNSCIKISPGTQWIAWHTKKHDKTMVVTMDVEAASRQGSTILTVASSRALARTKTFPWEIKAPFAVESCLSWM